MAKQNVRIVRREQASAWQVDADLCVVGAGISGISAALEAAATGRKVVLVDSLPALGGQAVGSIIGTFCGLYSNGKGADRIQLTHGIADGILKDLGDAGALHHNVQPHTTVVYYDEVALGRWIEQKVRDAGITVVLGAVLRQARMPGRRIEGLELATRYGDVRVNARGYVDASGDAALTWLAGLPCREPDLPIFGTQMFVLEGLDEDHLPTRAEFTALIKEKAAQYGIHRDDGLFFRFPGRGTAAMNMTHMETPLDPIAASATALAGREQVDRVMDFLRAEYPRGFGQARIRAYAQPGIRQTRWIVGSHQLTVDEVKAATHFPDRVARTSWPVELHNLPEGYVWEPFGEDHVHTVPLRSLTPPDCDNLAVAGRCVDADAAALSSVRVMGPCIAMGAAAAHAIELTLGGSVHDLDIGALHERIRANI